jgi:ABC-type transporter Mla subunit MlaD
MTILDDLVDGEGEALAQQIAELNTMADRLVALLDATQVAASSTRRSLRAVHQQLRQVDENTYPPEVREAIRRLRRRFASIQRLCKDVEAVCGFRK